ncbi:MAG: type II toxin-antitoxin system VapC family toxin [Opitutaceae bacterium]|jgi:predicted nucleic acid-binding protein|nr:type II toxin-antitoxin system VapC family toxin [Opitutaceae bacterium]
MPPLRSTLVAVDTNVLLDLALPRDVVHDAVDLICKRVAGVRFIVPPTVQEELQHLSESAAPATRKQAGDALDSLLHVWGFQPVDYLPVGHGIVECVADRIREQGLLPVTERRDSFLLVEAALAGAAMLLTSDEHLLLAPAGRLQLLLREHDVASPVIVDPVKIVRDFFPKR